MIRKIYYTIWNSSVKGFYRTAKKNPVNPECMGDWMDTLKTDPEETFGLVDEGRFSEITADKLKKIPDGIIDVFYKNWEVCGVYSTVQDAFEWCTEDVGTCMFQENFMPRLVEGATPLLMKAYDLYRLLTDEAICMNDTQNLQLVERMLVDATTIISTMLGFEGKFGSLKASSEIKSLDRLGTDLDDAIEAYTKLHANDPPQPSLFDTTDLGDFS